MDYGIIVGGIDEALEAAKRSWTWEVIPGIEGLLYL